MSKTLFAGRFTGSYRDRRMHELGVDGSVVMTNRSPQIDRPSARYRASGAENATQLYRSGRQYRLSGS